MYNRVGRALFIVGKQFRQKLCENVNNASLAPGCAVNRAILHCAPNTYSFRRSYCNKNSDESDDEIPTLMSTDEEGAIAVKEFLSVPENQKLYKIIELEIDVMRQNNDKVPEVLKPRHWAELIRLDSRSKRRRYLTFVWGVEKKKDNDKRAREEKRKVYEELLAAGEIHTNPYSLGTNALFLRFYESTMNQMWNNRLIQRMMYGQPVVLDCSYENHMNPREIKNCAKQLQLTFAANRYHNDPFDMYFCNANLHGELMKTLHRAIPTLYEPEFPLNIKTNSYLDVFDKKRLVYLTPHCTNVIKDFDHDAVYIVGAYVDKSSDEPVSLAKAKKEGLKMAKLPLDRYLQWGASSGKNLTLNQVVNILLDARMYGSWEKALQHVPRRKLYESRVAALERKVRSNFRVSSCYEDEETVTPVQEIKPKIAYRYNADKSQQKRDGALRTNDYRSNYKQDYAKQNSSWRDSRSIFRDDSESHAEKDFSLKARAKFKNNWKN